MLGVSIHNVSCVAKQCVMHFNEDDSGLIILKFAQYGAIIFPHLLSLQTWLERVWDCFIFFQDVDFATPVHLWDSSMPFVYRENPMVDPP